MDKFNLIRSLREKGFSEKVLQACTKVDRIDFTPKKYLEKAYVDIPIPLGHGSTISQPSTILAMLDALDIQLGNKILEIGTGSGYTSTLLSELTGEDGEVITLEVSPIILEYAKQKIRKKNIKIKHADGSQGCPEEAPFDRIIVTAGCPVIPEKLVEQLKNKGKMVIPLGEGVQRMYLIEKENNKINQKYLGEFIFVPLKKK